MPHLLLPPPASPKTTPPTTGGHAAAPNPPPDPASVVAGFAPVRPAPPSTGSAMPTRAVQMWGCRRALPWVRTCLLPPANKDIECSAVPVWVPPAHERCQFSNEHELLCGQAWRAVQWCATCGSLFVAVRFCSLVMLSSEPSVALPLILLALASVGSSVAAEAHKTW